MTTSLNNNGSVFYFSLGLLFVVICVVVVLWFNRLKEKPNDLENWDAIFEFQRLSFAAALLTGLGLIFLESMAMYYWSSPNEEAGKNIFETCKTIIPPIITLVIGYYFGQSRDGRKSDESILIEDEKTSNKTNTKS